MDRYFPGLTAAPRDRGMFPRSDRCFPGLTDAPQHWQMLSSIDSWAKGMLGFEHHGLTLEAVAHSIEAFFTTPPASGMIPLLTICAVTT
eukprot:1136157-Pelagomonas_calceolata.AAC.9